jgi:hypothetical protein
MMTNLESILKLIRTWGGAHYTQVIIRPGDEPATFTATAYPAPEGWRDVKTIGESPEVAVAMLLPEAIAVADEWLASRRDFANCEFRQVVAAEDTIAAVRRRTG